MEGPIPRSALHGSSCCHSEKPLLRTECKVHSCDVLEVGLPCGIIGDVVGAEVRAYVVHFNRSDLNDLSNGNSRPPPNSMAKPLLSPLPLYRSLAFRMVA